MDESVRYPIGPFQPPASYSDDWRREAIERIAAMPNVLRNAVSGLTSQQLDTEYRPGGWTVRQVVHHVADSHLNAYVRFKLALTEDRPTIKPYDQAKWAELADARSAPVEVSLEILDGVHYRWTSLLREMTVSDFGRQYHHPETGTHTLDYMLAMYSWHGAHHTEQIVRLRQRMKW
ncbi:MAG TPA: putative metal-dependent hydrolase [Gemmatimonadaceae bacterium]|nr:putative metal-dependent hydrolase [Gemmatimonadaceae bacterium]